MPRQRRISGDVVRIDLGDGTHTYARVMAEACFAFYDSRTTADLDAPAVVASPVLFVVPVMDHAVTGGRWPRVGNVPLEAALAEPPPLFIRDKINPAKFFLYRGGQMTPATRAECAGLECCAAWDPTHVEDRLRDHYAGRPNKWLESMRIKDPP
jgi:hypothetical protein